MIARANEKSNGTTLAQEALSNIKWVKKDRQYYVESQCPLACSTPDLNTAPCFSCRTVASYGLQNGIVEKYEDSLHEPIRAGIKQGLLSGLTVGATAGVFSCSYALAIWYGARQVADGNYDGNELISPFGF